LKVANTIKGSQKRIPERDPLWSVDTGKIINLLLTYMPYHYCD